MTRYRDNLKAGEYDRLAKADEAGEEFVQFGATGKGPEDPDAPVNRKGRGRASDSGSKAEPDGKGQEPKS
jgi:hypothetical protein